MTGENPVAAIPLHWRLLDGIESVAAALWPRRFARATPWLFLAPAFLLVFVLVVGLVWVAGLSLHELDTSTYRLKPDYTLVNYTDILGRPVYLKIIARSVLAAAIVTFVTIALAFPYAYVMVRTPSARLRKLLLVSLFLPFFIGQVVRAYGWLIVLGHQGIINGLLGLIGLGPFAMIANYGAVIVGLIQFMLPFAVLLLAPAIVAIPEEVELASESLGAHWLRTFLHVTVPMAKPGLVAASVVVFTLTVTDYAMPEILGGGTTDFIANAIYDFFFQISDSGLGSALSVILVALGSLLVAMIFALVGAGTLSFVKERGR
jgi:putative spermidine/putrescine transport system permease protein